ncbi:MAG: hypothetical protein L0Z51_04025 [Candidatus Latescibacteria bacterium]|nr:hypothetical protein [Candidatus Latescibacterota bacterium]
MATYYELVIKGDDRDLIPYLAGYLTAEGVDGVYFAEESGLHVHALRERIKHHGEVQHVVCTKQSLAIVLEALEDAAPRYRFEVVEQRALASASFRFKVETPSRKIAQEVKDIVAKCRRGVEVEGYSPSETVSAEGAGAEIYSPMHDYKFEASAAVSGDVARVIEMRKALGAIDFVDCEEIDLHAA